jgi:membrane protease YdiL (CAAX protease family)
MWYKHPVICLLVASVFIALGYVVGGILSIVVFTNPYVGDGNITQNSAYSALVTGLFVYIFYFIYLKFYEKRPFEELTFKHGIRSTLLEIIYGLLSGTLLVSFLVLIFLIFGLYTAGSKLESVSLDIFVYTFIIIGIGSAFLEELIFRGVIFRLTENWLGSWNAILLSGLLFGLVHITNPNSTVFSSVAISLEAGVLLAAVYMLTRRLWMVIGLHAAWNAVQGLVFGIPVSGIFINGLMQIEAVPGKNELLTGGKFGLEASLITIIMLTSISILILIRLYNDGDIVPSNISSYAVPTR